MLEYHIKNDNSNRLVHQNEQLALEESEILSNKFRYLNQEKRTDLTNLATYAIDDEGSEEIDDALSIEERTSTKIIWIHIANPTSIVSLEGYISKSAESRGSSIYLIDNTISMFPKNLIKNILSLDSSKIVPALSVGVEISNLGEIQRQIITLSWIKLKYKLTYQEADELIDYAPKEEKDLEKINAELTRRRNYRNSNGAFSYNNDRGKIYLKNGLPDIKILENNTARIMVSEGMITFGSVIADYGYINKVPLPYRSQYTANYNKSNIDHYYKSSISEILSIQSLPKTIVSVVPRPHLGLGLKRYVQATSPLRRYLDFIVHYQVISSLFSENNIIDNDSLKDIINFNTRKNISNTNITRENELYWRNIFFSKVYKGIFKVYYLKTLSSKDLLYLFYFKVLENSVPLVLRKKISLNLGQELIVHFLYINEEDNPVFEINKI